MLGQLFFPSVVDLIGIEVGEDEVKDFRVPTGGVTLNTFLDILLEPKKKSISKSVLYMEMCGNGRVSPLEARASRKCYRRGK